MEYKNYVAQLKNREGDIRANAYLHRSWYQKANLSQGSSQMGQKALSLSKEAIADMGIAQEKQKAEEDQFLREIEAKNPNTQGKPRGIEEVEKDLKNAFLQKKGWIDSVKTNKDSNAEYKALTDIIIDCFKPFNDETDGRKRNKKLSELEKQPTEDSIEILDAALKAILKSDVYGGYSETAKNNVTRKIRGYLSAFQQHLNGQPVPSHFSYEDGKVRIRFYEKGILEIQKSILDSIHYYTVNNKRWKANEELDATTLKGLFAGQFVGKVKDEFVKTSGASRYSGKVKKGNEDIKVTGTVKSDIQMKVTEKTYGFSSKLSTTSSVGIQSFAGVTNMANNLLMYKGAARKFGELLYDPEFQYFLLNEYYSAGAKKTKSDFIQTFIKSIAGFGHIWLGSSPSEVITSAENLEAQNIHFLIVNEKLMRASEVIGIMIKSLENASRSGIGVSIQGPKTATELIAKKKKSISKRTNWKEDGVYQPSYLADSRAEISNELLKQTSVSISLSKKLLPIK